jgi:hypothetical protein
MFDWLFEGMFYMAILFTLVAFVLPVVLFVTIWITDQMRARKRRKRTAAVYLEKRMMTPQDGVYISQNVFKTGSCRQCRYARHDAVDHHYYRLEEMLSEAQ